MIPVGKMGGMLGRIMEIARRQKGWDSMRILSQRNQKLGEIDWPRVIPLS